MNAPCVRVAIWDLDNCLADDGWRIHKIDWSTNDPTRRYAAYHAACAEDNVEHKHIFMRMRADGIFPVFITGRPEEVRADTEDWIWRKLDVATPTVLMRPAGNNQSSVDLKRDLLRHFISGATAVSTNFDIAAAFDDHEGIVRMYADEFDIPAQVLKIHNLDAYRNEAELTRDGAEPLPTDPAPIEELGPVQGASPGVKVERIGPITVPEILSSMAFTFQERNAQYRDNYRMVPQMMAVLFPDGVPPDLVLRPHFHLFELMLVKLTRFAASELTHIDSIHDIAPYAAMIEAILRNKE